MLPGMVREVLMSPPRDMRVPISGLGAVSTDLWRVASDALKADAQARVAMDDLLPAPAPHRPASLAIMLRPSSGVHARKIEEPPEPEAA